MHVIARVAALLGAVAWVALAPATLLAQEGSSAPEKTQEETNPGDTEFTTIAPPPGIEAIEVTGEQLDTTNVQDQAAAITAFNADALDRLQIGNVDKLALNVPGLHVGQQGQNAIITLRGVGTENSSITGETGVAFHVDGIYYGSPAAARTAFYDIQMIDVKRGPQGLQGGKNSTSGSINVMTNDPSADYEVRGDFTMGNYDRQRARGVINVPLGEMLSARLALFKETRDGYLERDQVIPNFSPNNAPTVVGPSDMHIVNLGRKAAAFDLDNYGMRAKLRLQATESLDFVVGYDYFKEGGNGPQADIVPLNPIPCRVPLGSTPIPPGTTTRIGLVAGCRTPAIVNPVTKVPGPSVFYPATTELDPRKTYTDFPSSQDDTYWGWLGKSQWEAPTLPLLGDTTVKFLQGYRENDINFNWDFDGSDQEIFNLFNTTLVRENTSELQWSGGERLTWQGSLFFQRQTGETRLMSPGSEGFPDPSITKFPDLTSLATYEDSVKFDTEQWTRNRSYGAALDGSYALTDSLTFNLGGRWNKDKKETYLARRSTLNGNVFEACSPKVDANGTPTNTDYAARNESQVTELTPTGLAEPLPPKCGLLFRGTNWGTRLEWKPSDDQLIYAGLDRGYKSGGFASGGIGDYKPEKIWAYTLGSKSEFFDQRLQLNLEGFFYNYTDMQLTLIDATKLRTENADARMYGLDIEMRANPIDGLRLQGLVSLLHTEVLDYFSLDPATLGDAVASARLSDREQLERRGLGNLFPKGTTPGGDLCQTAHTEPINGKPVFFPTKRCSQFGAKDGLDDFSGNQLSRSPELKWNISAEYDIPLGRLGTLTPGFQYSWQDLTYYRVFNQYFDKQDAYHETNLRVMWASPEQMWEVEAFVNNVEDNAIKQNILIGPSTFGSIPLAWYGEPRFYGVRVGFKY